MHPAAPLDPPAGSPDRFAELHDDATLFDVVKCHFVTELNRLAQLHDSRGPSSEHQNGFGLCVTQQGGHVVPGVHLEASNSRRLAHGRYWVMPERLRSINPRAPALLAGHEFPVGSEQLGLWSG